MKRWWWTNIDISGWWCTSLNDSSRKHILSTTKCYPFQSLLKSMMVRLALGLRAASKVLQLTPYSRQCCRALQIDQSKVRLFIFNGAKMSA